MYKKLTADQALELVKGKVIQDIRSEVIKLTPYKKLIIRAVDPESGEEAEISFTAI